MVICWGLPYLSVLLWKSIAHRWSVNYLLYMGIKNKTKKTRLFFADAWPKWLTFCRKNFQMYFSRDNYSVVTPTSLNCLSENLYDDSFCLVPYMRKPIVCIGDVPVCWYIYSSQGLSELNIEDWSRWRLYESVKPVNIGSGKGLSTAFIPEIDLKLSST